MKELYMKIVWPFAKATKSLICFSFAVARYAWRRTRQLLDSLGFQCYPSRPRSIKAIEEATVIQPSEPLRLFVCFDTWHSSDLEWPGALLTWTSRRMNIGFLRQAAWACILLILASGHTGCEFKSPEDADNGIGSVNSGSSVSNAPSKQATQLPSGPRQDGKIARFDYNFHIKIANVRRQIKCLEALELLHIDSNTASQGGGGLGESWESFPYGPDAKNGATATFYYVRDAEKARTGDFNYLVNGISIQYQGVIYSYNYDSARERYLFVD